MPLELEAFLGRRALDRASRLWITLWLCAVTPDLASLRASDA